MHKVILPSLGMVLQAVAADSFQSFGYRFVALVDVQTVLLVALASGRRVSEWQALGGAGPYLVLGSDQVVLCRFPGLVHMVCSVFISVRMLIFQHWQIQVLPPWRWSVALGLNCLGQESSMSLRDCFVLAAGAQKVEAAVSPTFSRWIVEVIGEAYRLAGRTLPLGLPVRGLAANLICRAAKAGIWVYLCQTLLF